VNSANFKSDSSIKVTLRFWDLVGEQLIRVDCGTWRGLWGKVGEYEKER
jgi:hypothetical protein